MGNYQRPLSIQVRAATGALIAGGMLFVGAAGVGFAAPGNNNGNHFGQIKHAGDAKQGGGNPGQGKGQGGGNTDGGSRTPADPETPTISDSFAVSFGGDGSDLLLCAAASVLSDSCPEDP